MPNNEHPPKLHIVWASGFVAACSLVMIALITSLTRLQQEAETILTMILGVGFVATMFNVTTLLSSAGPEERGMGLSRILLWIGFASVAVSILVGIAILMLTLSPNPE